MGFLKRSIRSASKPRAFCHHCYSSSSSNSNCWIIDGFPVTLVEVIFCQAHFNQWLSIAYGRSVYVMCWYCKPRNGDDILLYYCSPVKLSPILYMLSSSSSRGASVVSVLHHSLLPRVFESRRGHIWTVYHRWLPFITFGGRSACTRVAVKHQSSSWSSSPSSSNSWLLELIKMKWVI